MNKILTTIAAALFLLLSAPSFAGYVIHLKDGTQFVTDQYLEEGNLIKFKRYGGLIGIEKERVSDIKQIEDLPEVKAANSETEVTAAKDEAGKHEGAVGDEKGKQKMKENETGNLPEIPDTKEKKAEQNRAIHDYRSEKKALKVQLDAAIEKVREASKNRDFAKKKEMIEVVRKIAKEMQRLTDEVKQMNNGKLPDDW